jgi:hypothetical protein
MAIIVQHNVVCVFLHPQIPAVGEGQSALLTAGY